MGRETILKVEQISKSFRNKKILSSISFALREKEILGITGLSGTGKSTLLNLITGLTSSDSGKITFKDLFLQKNWSPYDKNSKQFFGYSTQEPALYNELSVQDNIKLYGSLVGVSGLRIKARIKDLMELLELNSLEHEKVANLSVGMKKRVDLMCSLLHDPQLLILDEPTANLDFKVSQEIIYYIKKIHAKGVSMLYVSHDLDELQKIADKVLLIHNTKATILKPKSLKKQMEILIK